MSTRKARHPAREVTLRALVKAAEGGPQPATRVAYRMPRGKLKREPVVQPGKPYPWSPL